MTAVFIPTRNRRHCLKKALPHWLSQRNVDEINLVVEPWEYRETRLFASNYPKHVKVVNLKRSNQGVNFARAEIVNKAWRAGHTEIIMSDDDIYPHPDSDVARLYEWDGLNTIGIGCMMSFYGLTFGNDTIRDRDDPLFIASALGKRLFSLNLDRMHEMGLNFDPRFYGGHGDNELVRDAMKAGGCVWYVHAGVWGVSIAKRYEPGGLNDLAGESAQQRAINEAAGHALAYEKWGRKYISPLPGKLSCRWKNMLNDFVPGWEELKNWENE